jgi:RNA polymerase sigma-70 factor (ECF subfamily)
VTTKDRELRQDGECGPSSMATSAAYVSVVADEPVPRSVAESDLVERLRRGDREAATEFYDLYAARIHRFILRALGASSTTHDADDLMQETFIAIAEGLPFFRGDSALFTFACAIAHRKTMSFLRTNARRARIASTIVAPELNAAPEASGDENVQRAFASLKPEYREMLHLKYVEEATTAEIAKIMKATEHAIESKLKRARAALKKSLGNET